MPLKRSPITRLSTAGLWLVCAWQVTNGLLLSLLAARNWRWLCQRRRTLLATGAERDLSVAVLLAAYQEAGTIETCLWAINQLDRRDVSNLAVYVIGTAREEGDRHAPGHTFAAVAAVRHAPGFSVEVRYVHDPSPVGGKAEQLNYALAMHHAELESCDYLLVLDADVVVSPDLLTIAARELALRRAQHMPEPIVLQPLVVTTPPAPGSGGLTGGLLAADAMMQTRWRLGFELTRMRAAGWAAAGEGTLRRIVEPVVYCVGACLFVQTRYALRHGFPTPVEDTALGYRLTFARQPMAPIPALAFNPNEARVGDIIRQSGSWFLSGQSIYRELAAYLAGPDARTPEDRARAIWMVARDQGRMLSWLPAPCIITALIALHLRRSHPRDWRPVRLWVLLFLLDATSCERAIAWMRARPCGVALAGFDGARVGTTLVGCHLRWAIRSALPALSLVGQWARCRLRSDVATWRQTIPGATRGKLARLRRDSAGFPADQA